VHLPRRLTTAQFRQNHGRRHDREAMATTRFTSKTMRRREEMNEQTVEALSRRAAVSMSRRTSLLSLSGALAAAIAAPSLVQAKKDSKKGRKKSKRKAAERAENEADQICQSQVAGCRAHVLDVCQLPGFKCIQAADCCSSLGACDVNGFFSCVAAVTTAPD
jgi:hypothetical protein